MKAVTAQVLVLGLLAMVLQVDNGLALAQKPLYTNSNIKAQQSVLMIRVSDGKVLYEEKADELVSPASVTKIITAATALAKWGPRYKFKTRFFADGQVKGGVVQGPLVIVGDGDPFLVNEQLWQMAVDLSHLGIKVIAGDLVLDNSLFDTEIRDESRQGSERASQHAYDAPISALGVNFNTLAVALVPGEREGMPAKLLLDPYPVPNVILDNKLSTKSGAATQASIDRVGGGRGQTTLRAQGSVGVDAGIKKIYRSTVDPVATTGEIIRTFLEQQGIKIQGRVREGRSKTQAKLLYTLESFELARIVQGLNKFSNNYIADVITKRLGAAFPLQGVSDGVGQGTYANGMAVIERFLREEVGIRSSFSLRNGSGLNTENRLSARQVVQVLRYMESRFDLFPEFLMSLPSAGEDGTLAKRFKNSGDEAPLGVIRAKTGTLSQPISVAGLAGYLRHPKHGLVAFSLIDNGIAARAQPSVAQFRETQDMALMRFLQEK